MSFYSRTLSHAPSFLCGFPEVPRQWIAVLLGVLGVRRVARAECKPAADSCRAVVPLEPGFPAYQEIGPPSPLVGRSQGYDDRPAILDEHLRHRPPRLKESLTPWPTDLSQATDQRQSCSCHVGLDTPFPPLSCALYAPRAGPWGPAANPLLWVQGPDRSVSASLRDSSLSLLSPPAPHPSSGLWDSPCRKAFAQSGGAATVFQQASALWVG